MSRFRNVCFTSFDNEEPKYIPDIMSYLVYGLEICPSTGKWHWQGYIEFVRQISRRQLKEVLGSAHFEHRHGTAQEAAEYCAKEGEYCEHGEISNPGRRTDLRSVAQSIVDGNTIHNVAIESPSLFVQYGRGLSLLAEISAQQRQSTWRNVRCSIWWGKTGTGKTKCFFSQYELSDSYRFVYRDRNDFWNGYSGQKHILFDEFESQIRLSNMLMYMDGHPLQLDVKFGHSYANWESVTIISNSNPNTFYHNCDINRRAAFARRISEVIEYQSPDTRIISNELVFNNTVEFVSNDIDF